jgi:hypothetical protein
MSMLLNLLTMSTSAPFNPLNIPNCILWLQADRGITLDGSGNVSNWEDQSEAGHGVSQGTEANRPPLSENILKGLPVISFNGSTDLYLANTDLGIGSQVEVTTITIQKNNQHSVRSQPIAYRGAGVDLLTFEIQSNLAVWAMASSIYGVCAYTSDVPIIVTLGFNGNGADNPGKFQGYISNVQKTLSFTGTMPSSTGSISQICVGKRYTSSSDRFNGYVFAHLMYTRRLNSDELAYLWNGFGQMIS